MKSKISIVVPVYKVEETLLRRSIESILAQTYSNIEVLVVDDGSPDNCGAICDEYASTDNRLTVFHNENRGVSAARNYGIDRSCGEYLFFVDSDDYLELTTLDILVEAIEKNNGDCCICSANHVKEGSQVVEKSSQTLGLSRIYNQKEAVEALCYMEQPYDEFEIGAVWGTLYRKNVVDTIRFNENMKIGEDFEFKLRVFFQSKRIICVENKLYNYLIRSQSAMRNGFDKSKLDSITELKKLLNTDKDALEYRDAIVSRVCNISIVVLFMIPPTAKYRKYREPIIKYLKDNRVAVLKNARTRKKVKISLLLSYLGFDFIQKVFFTAKG